jgi:DNA-binding NtrC family response regulator
MKPAILMVDDEPAVLFGYARYFAQAGYETADAASLAEARKAVQARRFDAVLLDLNLPDGNGLEWIPGLREEHPAVAIVVITGKGDIPTAVEAMRRGADHFLVKPVDMEGLEVSLRKSLELSALRRADRLSQRLKKQTEEPCFGESAAMAGVRESLVLMSGNDSPLLIQGETGTGKGVCARWVHDRGLRKDGPLVELNCSAMHGELLASELFGHAKGAFTSAHQSKQGLIEVADGGTLFLDEIGDMDPAVQAQLLKVIEEKTYRRLGETANRQSDFRLICATNRDLPEQVRQGRFRSDLYFRINLFPVTIPPLRERTGDIPCLAEHFLSRAGHADRTLPQDVTELLLAYSWPGNVRELRNVIERAVLLARGGGLTRDHFPGIGAPHSGAPAGPHLQRTRSLKDLEKEYLQNLIAESGGDLKQVAAVLDVSRATLYRKIKELREEK